MSSFVMYFEYQPSLGSTSVSHPAHYMGIKLANMQWDEYFKETGLTEAAATNHMSLLKLPRFIIIVFD